MFKGQFIETKGMLKKIGERLKESESMRVELEGVYAKALQKVKKQREEAEAERVLVQGNIIAEGTKPQG